MVPEELMDQDGSDLSELTHSVHKAEVVVKVESLGGVAVAVKKRGSQMLFVLQGSSGLSFLLVPPDRLFVGGKLSPNSLIFVYPKSP